MENQKKKGNQIELYHEIYYFVMFQKSFFWIILNFFNDFESSSDFILQIIKNQVYFNKKK